MNPKESTEQMSIEYTPGPLLDAARNTPTALWNDSADPDELRQSISFGGVGATCNPTIAYTCINQRKDVWLPRIAELAEEMPEATESEIGWQVVREMSIEAATLLEPIFEEHKGRNGRLSMQTDPRLARSAKALADQAEEFSNLAKNIIVKIPATSVGVKAIEDATYRGIDPGHLEWGGVAALKRAYQEFRARGLRARVLSAAFRNVLQWSELVGGDLVVSPPFAWQRLINDSDYKVVERIDEPVAPEIMETLLSIPEFVRAYEPDGMTPEEFDSFGATRRTLRGFLQADADLDALVRDVIMPQP